MSIPHSATKLFAFIQHITWLAIIPRVLFDDFLAEHNFVLQNNGLCARLFVGAR